MCKKESVSSEWTHLGPPRMEAVGERRLNLRADGRRLSAENGGKEIPPDQDPSVASVTRIYDYFKMYGYKTQMRGASFHNIDQIKNLAGCDLLTVRPDLLDKLTETQGTLQRKLDPATAKSSTDENLYLDEQTFRWMHNEDAMATDKLAEGIRKFYADARKLEKYALSKVAATVAG